MLNIPIIVVFELEIIVPKIVINHNSSSNHTTPFIIQIPSLNPFSKVELFENRNDEFE